MSLTYCSQIWKLREELGAYATTYGVYDSHPPHPNHHQTWFSKNLRCTVCTESCGICGVACCKWNEAKIAEREAYLASEEMVAATRTIQRIEVYLLTGFDLPTFLRCTECRKLVCPSCCGQCPVTMCKDLRCNVGVSVSLGKAFTNPIGEMRRGPMAEMRISR
jgi:hypothetical protein